MRSADIWSIVLKVRVFRTANSKLISKTLENINIHTSFIGSESVNLSITLSLQASIKEAFKQNDQQMINFNYSKND